MEDKDKALEEEQEDQEVVRPFLDEIKRMSPGAKSEAQQKSLEDFLEEKLRTQEYQKQTALRAKKEEIMKGLEAQGWKKADALQREKTGKLEDFFETKWEKTQKAFEKKEGRLPEKEEELVDFLKEQKRSEEAVTLLEDPKLKSTLRQQWQKMLIQRSLEAGLEDENTLEGFAEKADPLAFDTPESLTKALSLAHPEQPFSPSEVHKIWKTKERSLRKTQDQRKDSALRQLDPYSDFGKRWREQWDEAQTLSDREQMVGQIEDRHKDLLERYEYVAKKRADLEKRLPELEHQGLNQSWELLERRFDFERQDVRQPLRMMEDLAFRLDDFDIRLKDREATQQEEAFTAQYDIKKLVFPAKLLHEKKLPSNEFKDLLRKKMVVKGDVWKKVEEDFTTRSKELYGIYQNKWEAQASFDTQIDSVKKRTQKLPKKLGEALWKQGKKRLGTKIRPLGERQQDLAGFVDQLSKAEKAWQEGEAAWDKAVAVVPEGDRPTKEKDALLASAVTSINEGRLDLASYTKGLKEIFSESEAEVVEREENSKTVDQHTSKPVEEETLEKKGEEDLEEVVEERQEEEDVIMEEPEQQEAIESLEVDPKTLDRLGQMGVPITRWNWDKLAKLSLPNDKSMADGLDRLVVLLEAQENKPLQELLARPDNTGLEGFILPSLSYLSADEFTSFQNETVKDLDWEGEDPDQGKAFVEALWEESEEQQEIIARTEPLFVEAGERFGLKGEEGSKPVEQDTSKPVEEETLDKGKEGVQEEAVEEVQEPEEGVEEQESMDGGEEQEGDTEREVQELLETIDQQIEEQARTIPEQAKEKIKDPFAKEAAKPGLVETPTVIAEVEELLQEMPEEVLETPQEEEPEPGEVEEETEEMIEPPTLDPLSAPVESTLVEEEAVAASQQGDDQATTDNRQQTIDNIDPSEQESLETEEEEQQSEAEVLESEELEQEEAEEEEALEQERLEEEQAEAEALEQEEEEQAEQERLETEEEEQAEAEVLEAEEEEQEALEQEIQEQEEAEQAQSETEAEEQILEEAEAEAAVLEQAQAEEEAAEQEQLEAEAEEQRLAEEQEEAEALEQEVLEQEAAEQEAQEAEEEEQRLGEEQAEQEQLEAEEEVQRLEEEQAEAEEQEAEEEEQAQLEAEAEEQQLAEEQAEAEVLEQETQEQEEAEIAEKTEIEAQQKAFEEALEEADQEALETLQRDPSLTEDQKEQLEEALDQQAQQKAQTQGATQDEEQRSAPVFAEEGEASPEENKGVRDEALEQTENVAGTIEGEGENLSANINEAVAEENSEKMITPLTLRQLIQKLQSLSLMSDEDYQVWLQFIQEVFREVHRVKLQDLLSRFDRYIDLVFPEIKITIDIAPSILQKELKDPEGILSGLLWTTHQQRPSTRGTIHFQCEGKTLHAEFKGQFTADYQCTIF